MLLYLGGSFAFFLRHTNASKEQKERSQYRSINSLKHTLLFSLYILVVTNGFYQRLGNF
jgi:hypothetical protein